MFYYLDKDNYPEVVRETDKYIIYIPNPKSYGSTQTKERKFLVIGGPFHGEYMTRTQLRYATMPGVYREFNNAGSSRHKVVFVFGTEDL